MGKGEKQEEEDKPVLGWCIEYAKTGKSTCKASKKQIEEGAVRIGKEIDNPYYSGKVMPIWYIPEALFASFRKGGADKARVTKVAQLKGLTKLKKADQARITKMVQKEAGLRSTLTAGDKGATYLENEDGKFWSAVAVGACTRVRYGDIGAAGMVSEKTHGSAKEAKDFVDKMVKDKVKKGYVKAVKGKAKAASKRKAEADAAPPAKKKKAAGGGDDDGPVRGWVVEYAKSSKSTCRASGELIEEGAVRIGKEVDNPHYSGKTMQLWYVPEPLFASFRKGSATKPRVTKVGQLKGYAKLKAGDATRIAKLVEKEAGFRSALSTGDAGAMYLENDDGKFWSVVAVGAATRVRYGDIGAGGMVSEKTHGSAKEAKAFAEKMVKDKEKKGYHRAKKKKGK